MAQIFTEDIGTVIIIDTQTDLTGLTDQEVIMKLPDGKIITKDAEVVSGDEAGGLITFTSVIGDWNQAGAYTIQARITFGANIFYGTIATFNVLEVL